MKTPILLALIMAIAALAMPSAARAEGAAQSRNGRHLCHHHHHHHHHMHHHHRR